MAKPFLRYFEFDRAQLNEGERTVPVCFSSENPVDRGEYEEVLDHAPENMDLRRLGDSAAVLLNHCMDRQIGVVEKPELSGDKKGRALIRFGRSDLATEIFNDVKDGIRKHMSVGYERIKALGSEVNAAGKRCIRFAWRPYEISVVPVPADPDTGVGRSILGDQKRTMMNDECSWLCRGAMSAVNNALGIIEKCGQHLAAIAPCRDAIAATAITMDDVAFWSESTAAECVAVCAECAGYCDQAIAALRAAAGCAMCGEIITAAIHELEECAESCRMNAGHEPKNAQKAVEGTIEAEAQSETVIDPDTRAKTDSTETNVDKTAPMTNAPGSAQKEQIMADVKDQTIDPTLIEGARTKAIELERTRVRTIQKAVEQVSINFPDSVEMFRGMASKAVDDGQSAEDFNANLLTKLPGVRKATIITAENLGLSERDANQYSLARAIQCVLRTGKPEPDGLEGEVHKAMLKRIKENGAAVSATGFWVPHDIGFASGNRVGRRDLNVTTPTQGGQFVQTTIFTPIIEIFRNKMVTSRLGVQSMAGLEGNIAIPRQTGTATAYSLAESATLTKSTQAIDQINLTPHRVGAYNDYTKQLLLQSSVDVENFIREDLMKVLAIKWDKLILEGSGAGSEPTGVLHTQGIGSVTFGAAPTFAKAVEFETSLALANADIGLMAYVTSPGVRGVWKVTPKVAASTFPIFLWEKGDWGDGTNDGEVNSYRAVATNQIANNAVAFGHWADSVHALWGGYDVVVNPYSRDIDAVVRITVNTFGDFAARHAASFAWSSDSGAQSA